MCVVVYVLGGGIRRGRGRPPQPDRRRTPPVTAPPVSQELRKGIVVAGLVGCHRPHPVRLPRRRLPHRPGTSTRLREPDALTVKVTGHQWWWEVRYDDPTPSNIVTTANEIHIPVGRPVRFELASTDVIHSFWVPNLHGKTDLIPGHPTRTFIRADRPGDVLGPVRRVLRLPAREHAASGRRRAGGRLPTSGSTAQRQPAPEPTTDSQKRGPAGLPQRTVRACATRSRARTAQARVGPDLTHVASRPRIAAGTLPNTRGHLAGWIVDPQQHQARRADAAQPADAPTTCRRCSTTWRA